MKRSRSSISLPRRSRRGTTLVELMTTMVTSAILVSGLTASILISQKSLQLTTSQQQGALQQRQSIEQLRTDLREALTLESSTPSTLTLTVPDRNSDSQPETIIYNFPSDNSASVSRLANSVTTPFSMGTLTRTTQPSFSVPSTTPTTTPVLQLSGYSSALSSAATTTLAIPAPPNTLAGDLLVLVLASDSSSGTLTFSSGTWTNLIDRTASPLQLRVWHRLAVADETSILTLTSSVSVRMSATVLRISNHNGTIVAHTSTSSGTSSSPTSVGCATTSNNMLVFRVLAARDDSYIPDFTGLSNNNTVIMRSGDTSSSAVTIGVGYRKVPTPTASSTTNFILTNWESFITGSFAVGTQGI